MTLPAALARFVGLSAEVVGSGPTAGLAPLKAEVIIAVSTAGLSLPRVDLWLCVDWPFWHKRAPEGRPFGEVRVGVDPWGPPNTRPGMVDIWAPCKGRVDRLEWGTTWDEGLGRAGNSGYAALNLAWLLGMRPDVYGLDGGSEGQWTESLTFARARWAPALAARPSSG